MQTTQFQRNCVIFYFALFQTVNRLGQKMPSAVHPGGTGCGPYRSHPFYALKNRMEISAYYNSALCAPKLFVIHYALFIKRSANCEPPRAKNAVGSSPGRHGVQPVPITSILRFEKPNGNSRSFFLFAAKIRRKLYGWHPVPPGSIAERLTNANNAVFHKPRCSFSLLCVYARQAYCHLKHIPVNRDIEYSVLQFGKAARY